MIGVPTTLVLGAGASFPFGFPLGHELRKQLCDPWFLSELVSERIFQRSVVERFCDVFRKSQVPSIDAFLARRGSDSLSDGTTFSEVGKAAIAYALIKCEISDKLFSDEIKDHWYQYLWQFIGGSIEELEDSRLSIITFNYDRSLEAYLLTTMQHTFGIGAARAAECLKKIRIIHVYGQLGKLTGMASPGGEHRAFSPDTSEHNILIGAKGIKVIPESRDDEDTLVAARTLLTNATTICFLGFGFDDTNVRRLNLNEILRDRYRVNSFSGPSVFATTIGFKKAERARIINLLAPREEDALNLQPQIHERFEAKVKRVTEVISDHDTEENANYLRHTGVLLGKY